MANYAEGVMVCQEQIWLSPFKKGEGAPPLAAAYAPKRGDMTIVSLNWQFP
jgi:hypothetical protein